MSTTNDEMNSTKPEAMEVDGSSLVPVKDIASIKEVASSAQSLYQNDANATSQNSSTHQLTRDLEKIAVSDTVAADTQPEGGTQAWGNSHWRVSEATNPLEEIYRLKFSLS